MNSVLKEIFKTKSVVDENNNSYSLHSHTDEEQGLELQKIIRKIKPENTLEIGLAYGISSLFICEALMSVKGKKHTIIEPYPDVYWKNIGLKNIKRAGFEQIVDFRKSFSDEILPKLYYENYRIQFAYIDSTKVFDVILMDVYFITKILDIEGVLVLDDCGFPGIRKVARFLSQHPSFEIVLQYKQDKETIKKKVYRKVVNFLIDTIPYKNKLFPDKSFKSDEALGINYHCIAFKKITNDNRNWDWFKRF